MQCPVCKDAVLAMSERQGIEIDTCPRCRGIWLDRGELDKLVERSAEWSPPPSQGSRPREWREPKPNLRGSFLDELFD